MTIQLYANNAKTTLAAAVSSGTTTITVAPGTGALFPSPTIGQAFKVTLVSATSASSYEICLCTARTGDTLTVIRGQEGTSAQPFILGDVVGNFDTKGVMDDLVQTEQLQAQYYQYATAAGSANALTATVPSNLTTLPDGMYMTIEASTANTGPTTLNLTLGSTVTGVKPIYKGSNTALANGDIPAAGYPIQLNWSESLNCWIMQNPATGILVSAVPTGAIVQFPCATAPAGYLLCNGQTVSRTTYAALWTFAQSSGNLAASDVAWVQGQFSPGDGSTTFRLPQYGGYFLRSRDNGNGIDPSRTLGSVQGSQNQAHTHGVADPGHNHTFGIATVAAPGAYYNSVVYPETGNTYTQTSYTGIGIQSSGGSEARPINISVLTCIKY